MFNNDTTNNRSGFLVGAITALLLALPGVLFAQSSPLTVQPSTSRVGVGTTAPGETLDVNGTIKATAFKGDGSQLINLPVLPANTVMDRVTANTTVVNTAAETNLYSFSVPGGTLGSNSALRLTIQITDLDINIGETCVLRFKYGGTTLGSLNLTNSSLDNDITNANALITFTLAGDDTTAAQVGSAFSHASHVLGPILRLGTSVVDSAGPTGVRLRPPTESLSGTQS
jgi:hypothetical protein